VEIAQIIDKYQVGECIENHEPKSLAAKINAMIENKEQLLVYKQNCKAASKVLNWENEKESLINVLAKYAE
jgi:glycosyltransferase involved in cell wall biosynthesis